MKLYVASETERQAIPWAKASYGRKWRARLSESVADSERELRRMYPRTHFHLHSARPFGHQHMNIMLQAARHCLRRNTHFRQIARQMAIDTV